MATIAEMFVNIGADSSKFSKETKKAEGELKSLEKKFKAVGDSFKSIGENMTKNISAPLAGLGVAGFMAASDVQKSAGVIQASLGLTEDEAKDLTKSAQELWQKGFGENISEVARDVSLVAQNMHGLGQTSGSIEAITKQAYTLRDAFGAEVTESTRTAAVMMKNFGINATTAMDLMTVGFQKGGDYSGELLDTLREYSPSFSTMGHSAQDMLGILIAGAEAGAWNLDKVGDAVKEFNIRAKDGSETTADGFAMIGLNAEQMGAAIAEGGVKGQQAFQATIAALAAMEDPVARNTAGVALFGTQWEDLEADVVQAMATGVGSITEFNGATYNAGEALNNNIGKRALQVWRDFLTAMQPVGNALIEMAEAILPPLSAALGKVANWFTSLNPTMQKNIVIVAGIAAAIGPLLVVAGTLINAVSTLIPLFKAVRLAMLTATLPIAPMAAAIAALIAIGVLLYKNWDKIVQFARVVWAGIKAAFTTGVNATKTALQNGILAAVRFITGLKTTFFNAGKGLIDMMARGISNAASKVISTVKNLASKVRDFLPFSPAKTGPLSDLDKLDFGGPMADSIKHGTPTVTALMGEMVTMPEITPPKTPAYSSQPITNESVKNDKENQQQIINFARMLDGANINVTEENDAIDVARQLYRMTNDAMRAKGVKTI